jgi:hypothetical protein
MVAAEHAVADRSVVSIAGTADPVVGIADFVVETADSVAEFADSVAAIAESRAERDRFGEDDSYLGCN